MVRSRHQVHLPPRNLRVRSKPDRERLHLTVSSTFYNHACKSPKTDTPAQSAYTGRMRFSSVREYHCRVA